MCAMHNLPERQQQGRAENWCTLKLFIFLKASLLVHFLINHSILHIVKAFYLFSKE